MTGFSAEERARLLAVPFVGPKVIERFEQIGIDSLEVLAASQAHEILEAVAAMLGSTCWKNSPQSKKAVRNAIEAAKAALAGQGSAGNVADPKVCK